MIVCGLLIMYNGWVFSPWDLIMPLFLFMSGASMPFALSRFKGVSDKNLFSGAWENVSCCCGYSV